MPSLMTVVWSVLGLCGLASFGAGVYWARRERRDLRIGQDVYQDERLVRLRDCQPKAS